LIGIDGATWEVLHPLMRAGVMPTLAKLVDEGISTTLTSTIPPDTATAWTSFQTGMNPGKHGVFDFHQYNRGDYYPSFVNSERIGTETIWGILSRNKKKIILVNIPVTYPPQPINGCMVTGLLTPSIKSNFTYPTRLAREILDIEKDYTIITTQESFRNTSLDNFIEELIRTETKRTNVMRHLLEQYAWDVAMIHFQSTDPLQHAVFWYLDEKNPEFSPQNYQALQKFYRSIDRNIAALLNQIPRSALKIILSDHGFESVRKTIYINNILVNEGLLSLKKQGFFRQKLFALFRALRKLKGRFFKQMFSFPRSIALVAKTALVDWTRTKAFVLTGWLYGFIYLNLKGREKGGIVAEGWAYEELRESIAKNLSSIMDPETNTRVFRKIYKREEIYEGPHLKNAPDLIAVPEQGYECSQSFIETSDDIFKKNILGIDHTGTHNQDGICIFSGKDLDASRTLAKAAIIDIGPSLLYYCDCAIPSGMDGRVLRDIFSPEFRESHPLLYEDKEKAPKLTDERDIFSDEDKKKIEKRLKDLGYMD